MTDPGTRIGTSEVLVAEDGRRYAFADHNCFACGGDNPIGMRLRIEIGDGVARTAWVAGENFVGWSDKLHGGIIATMLDEVMAWALVGEDNWGVTARMNVAFRRPVEVGTTVRAEGWIATARRRVVDTAAHLIDAESGDELASATGVYVAASPDRTRYLRERYAFRPVDGEFAADDAATPGRVDGTT